MKESLPLHCCNGSFVVLHESLNKTPKYAEVQEIYFRLALFRLVCKTVVVAMTIDYTT
jgi:hypothetical protein